MPFILIIIVIILAVVFKVFSTYEDENCNFREEDARNILIKKLLLSKIDTSYLDEKGYRQNGCKYEFAYDGNGKYIGYYVTEEGEVHDHEGRKP